MAKRTAQRRQVYVVTKGDYSAYHILAVCSTKPRAKKVVTSYNKTNEYEKAGIEPFELDDPRMSVVTTLVFIQRNGNAKTTSMFGRETAITRFLDDGALRWAVDTDSQERAIKVANEKRLAILEAGIPWGDNRALGAYLKTPEGAAK